MTGLQCVKALVLHVHSPELATLASEDQKAVFDQGHEVGLAAWKLFPDGIAITADYRDTQMAIEQTKAAISRGATTLFEATFLYDDVLIKVDILHRAQADEDWTLIEVKSSTSVKDQYLDDLAVQAYVLAGSNIPISRIYLMNLNSKYQDKNGESLFVKNDLTERIAERVKEMPALVQRLRQFASAEGIPDQEIGPHCKSPYPCPFKNHCWQHVPSPSVFEVPRIGPKAWEYYKQGRVSINEILSDDMADTRRHQINAAISGERWIDKGLIGKNLSNWAFPFHFLDFETIGFALPVYPDTRPYQHVPFQFSCHVIGSLDDDPIHFEYLHEMDCDPRRGLAERLLAALGETGSIVSYNKKFEAERIKELALTFPEFREKLNAAIIRLVDPLPIFQQAVYDKAFKGSFSLKSVAPVILGPDASYEGLHIGNGGAAQRSFKRMISVHTTQEEKSHLRTSLLEYCKKDTLVMVGLVRWLYRQI